MARLEDGGPDREAATPLLGGGAGGGLPPVAISAVPKPVAAQLKALSLVLVTLQTTSMVPPSPARHGGPRGAARRNRAGA